MREFASYPSLFWKLMRAKNAICPQKLSYGEEKDQYLLHFAPWGEAKEKVIFYIHGGGWNSGNPLLFRFIGEKFAQEGYHCIMAGYRKTPRFSYPAQIEDIRAGYEKMIRYLKRRKIPSDQIVVAGSSAGAHLGALLCYDTLMQKETGMDINALQGFAGLGGPYYFGAEHSAVLRRLMKDLFPKEENGSEKNERMGFGKEEGEPYEKLHEGQKVPMLIIHGRHDGVVSYQNAAVFYAHASSLGIPAKFYTVSDGKDSHSVYTAGCFLEERKNCETLDALFWWIEKI